MRDFNPELTAESYLKTNQRLVVSYMEELYEEGDIYPGAGGLSGPAAVLYVTSGAPVVVLPNAVLTAWEMEIPVRKLWNRAIGVELTFLYTGPAASTNNMVITVAGFGVTVGSVQGAIADAYATGTTIPGPAVAQTVLSFTHRSTGSLFTPASKYIIPRIVRDGANAADTYPGDLHILAVHWRVFGQ